ncbi:MAG: ABC transporter permease [Candidatus Krumholzibacteria bacterium]|nr:ABC transporter permease [Candidatus Krumholzibacteria bacterium]
MRLLLEGIRIAYRALLVNKLRTFLTLLGNIVGIMAVIAVVSLLGGIDEYMRQEVASEGSNVFTIYRVDFFEAITDFESFTDAIKYNPNLDRDDVAALRRNVTAAAQVSGRVSRSARVGARNRHIKSIEVRGLDYAYSYVDNYELWTGRHVTPLENREKAQVAVIGWDVYTSLFKPLDPLGRLIRIGNRHFKVIGVATDRGSLLGQTRNRYVIIPLGAYGKLFGSSESLNIRVKAVDIRTLETAIEEAKLTMRIRHRLRPGEKDDFFISTSDQLVEVWKSISSGIMVALVALVCIAMVVGGIVLMNTMLVAVTERTREIGIRKAIGARRLAIVWQFLVESATLSVIGGFMGMVVGFVIAAAVSGLTVIPYTVDPAIVVIAFLVTVALGLVFGTYPAVKAARMDPVEALRNE